MVSETSRLNQIDDLERRAAKLDKEFLELKRDLRRCRSIAARDVEDLAVQALSTLGDWATASSVREVLRREGYDLHYTALGRALQRATRKGRVQNRYVVPMTTNFYRIER